MLDMLVESLMILSSVAAQYINETLGGANDYQKFVGDGRDSAVYHAGVQPV
jgi:hypothetical protein